MKKLPVVVQNILNEYMALLNEVLPMIVEGVYIQGSIALNAYMKDSSDIDFITVTNRHLLEEDIEVLSDIHNKIAEKHTNIEMDGVYIQWKDLGKMNADNQNFIIYNSGKLSSETYISPITWWILKMKGINFLGPDRTSLSFEISPSDLTTYVVENMNSYWVNRIERVKNSLKDLNKFSTEEITNEIEWSVLGLLRQYYTLKEQNIISKLGAGEYALQHVPAEWHKIIKESINIRNGIKENLFTSNQERIDAALAFSTYIINYCNNHLIKKKVDA